MMIDETTFPVKGYYLHKHTVARNFFLEREKMFRPHVKFEELLEHDQELQFRVLCNVFVYDAGSVHRVCDIAKWPADWWQAVKDRFAPKWFLHRWPVEYATKTVSHKYEVKAVLPRVIREQDHFYLYEFDNQCVIPDSTE